jgi:prolipoprotein diacylglyceryltransferase
MDRSMIVIPLALFCIRMGNLMNSEIYGHVTTLPWGFIFERNGETLPKHPTQLYEGFSYLFIFALLYLINSKTNIITERKGFLFGLSFILLFSARFLIEFVKEDQVNFEANMTLNMGQWLSIPFILVGMIVVYFSFQQKTVKK